MKRLILFLIAFVFCVRGSGQNIESFKYEAIVRNFAGEAVITKPVSVKFSILTGSTTGTVVYSEYHITTTSQTGLISLLIGKGTDKTGNFIAINWNADIYFLKVEIDPAGGTSYSEISVTQLLNVPYELQRKPSNKSAELLDEDEFLITRKYIGNFLDYRHTGPDTYSGSNLIWIKTSMDKTYGKISAYGKTCRFSVGDRLYLRKLYYSPGNVSGYWIYQIENDSSIYYRVSEYQYDKKVSVESMF
jgi:hypothetical protein